AYSFVYSHLGDYCVSRQVTLSRVAGSLAETIGSVSFYKQGSFRQLRLFELFDGMRTVTRKDCFSGIRVDPQIQNGLVSFPIEANSPGEQLNRFSIRGNLDLVLLINRPRAGQIDAIFPLQRPGTRSTGAEEKPAFIAGNLERVMDKPARLVHI